jgi:hypothetical protein
LKTKFGTLACPAALNLGRSQAALLVNPYHTGQAVPRAAVGFLSSAMHDFSGEVVPLKMWGQPPSAVRGAQLRCGRRIARGEAATEHVILAVPSLPRISRISTDKP